eukprot:528804-Rhodomonas_salina.4
MAKSRKSTATESPRTACNGVPARVVCGECQHVQALKIAGCRQVWVPSCRRQQGRVGRDHRYSRAPGSDSVAETERGACAGVLGCRGWRVLCVHEAEAAAAVSPHHELANLRFE